VRLIINQREEMLSNVPEFWGDLLRRLEDDAAARGELVSAVRFDGVDDPSFPDPSRRGRPLSEVGTIEVETETPHALVQSALTEGESSAQTLAAAALAAANAFRTGDASTGNARLADFGEGVRFLIAILDTVVTALNVTLDSLESDGRPVTAHLAELMKQLESMIAAQQSRDWATVADILEYELHPSLGAVRAVFSLLKNR
jgi:hypothetical protein